MLGPHSLTWSISLLFHPLIISLISSLDWTWFHYDNRNSSFRNASRWTARPRTCRPTSSLSVRKARSLWLLRLLSPRGESLAYCTVTKGLDTSRGRGQMRISDLHNSQINQIVPSRYITGPTCTCFWQNLEIIPFIKVSAVPYLIKLTPEIKMSS